MFSKFLSLFFILNPFGSIPLFLALCKNFTKKERFSIIVTESICVLVLMLAFYICGAPILDGLGITSNALRATGGLMLLKVGFQMNFPSKSGLSGVFGLKDGEKPFLIPIAMPMLVGAGLITSLIELSQHTEHFVEHIIMISVLSLLSGIILYSGELVMKFAGPRGLDILERLMGLVLIMMACQMLISVAQSIF